MTAERDVMLVQKVSYLITFEEIVIVMIIRLTVNPIETLSHVYKFKGIAVVEPSRYGRSCNILHRD